VLRSLLFPDPPAPATHRRVQGRAPWQLGSCGELPADPKKKLASAFIIFFANLCKKSVYNARFFFRAAAPQVRSVRRCPLPYRPVNRKNHGSNFSSNYERFGAVRKPRSKFPSCAREKPSGQYRGQVWNGKLARQAGRIADALGVGKWCPERFVNCPPFILERMSVDMKLSFKSVARLFLPFFLFAFRLIPFCRPSAHRKGKPGVNSP